MWHTPSYSKIKQLGADSLWQAAKLHTLVVDSLLQAATPIYLPTPVDFKTLPVDLRNFLALAQHQRLLLFLWEKIVPAISRNRESVNTCFKSTNI